MRSVTASSRCLDIIKPYPLASIAKLLFIENPEDKFLATNLFNCLFQLEEQERDDIKFNKFMKRLLEHFEMVEAYKQLLKS